MKIKHYSIKAYSTEERDKILEKVEEYGVKNIRRDYLVGTYYIEFDTDKITWKKIKKDLGLEVISLYAKRKIDI